jgi:tRNA(His) guanylyltransferase
MSMSLGDRMKAFYEDRFRFELMRRTYTLIRVDGKAFHTFTKKFKRPFDERFMGYMDNTAKYLCEKIMGARFAYVQSDEITIMLTDFDTHQTQAWFEYNVQKMASVTASMATARFNQMYLVDQFERMSEAIVVESADISKIKFAEFDARVFQVPNRIEAFNAVLWRQQDASRNSVSAVAQSLYSAKELHGKNSNQQQEMIFQKGTNWNDYEPYFKRGRIIRKEINEAGRTKWAVDRNIPIFSQEPDYLYNLIPEEELYEPQVAEETWVDIKNRPE